VDGNLLWRADRRGWRLHEKALPMVEPAVLDASDAFGEAPQLSPSPWRAARVWGWWGPVRETRSTATRGRDRLLWGHSCASRCSAICRASQMPGHGPCPETSSSSSDSNPRPQPPRSLSATGRCQGHDPATANASSRAPLPPLRIMGQPYAPARLVAAAAE